MVSNPRKRAASTSSSSTDASGTASSSSSIIKGKGKGRRSSSRDIEAEWDEEYKDTETYDSVLKNNDLNAVRIYSPVTTLQRDQILEKFIQYQAAALPRTLSREERIKQITEKTAVGKELPDMRVVLEFLRMYAKRAVGRVKGGGQNNMSLLSLRNMANRLLVAIETTHRARYEKTLRDQITILVHNAARGDDPLVKTLERTKRIVSYADMERMLLDLYDMKHGVFSGRTRIALQMVQFLLLSWAFGVRPGSLALNSVYMNAKGETQCLLNKDVEMQYEGLDKNGDTVVTAKATLRWLKGMRINQSENLVVRLRLLPRSKAHLDPLLLLIAHAIFRKAFKTDVMNILSIKPIATAERPIVFEYTKEALQWPVFMLMEGGSGKRQSRTAPTRVRAITRRKTEQKGKAKETEEEADAQAGADDTEDAVPEEEVKDFDMSVPATTSSINRALGTIAAHLGLHGLTAYDLRRTFAVNMRDAVPIETLRYLMGHRVDSKMTDKRYVADDRGIDTSSVRFGEEAEDVNITRNSIGWGTTQKTVMGSQNRLAQLAKAVQNTWEQVTRKYGSLEKAFELGEDNEDMQALLDQQALLLSEIDLCKIAKATSEEMLTLEATAGCGVVSFLMREENKVSEDAEFKHWLNSSMEETGLDQLPKTKLPLFAPDLDDLPQLPPMPESTIIANLPPMPASTLNAEASTSSANTNPPSSTSDSELTLSAQVEATLASSSEYLQHPLVAAMAAVHPGQALLTGIQFLLGRLRQNELLELKICIVCLSKGKSGLVTGYDHHTYACENKAYTDLQRCPFCSIMVPTSDEIAACSHLLMCAEQWKTRDFASEQPDTAVDPDEDMPIDGVSEAPAASTSASLTTAPASDAAVQAGKHIKVLLSPLKPPTATFAYTLVRVTKVSRPLCPLCVESNMEEWRENDLSGDVKLPFNNMNEFENHWWTHFTKVEGVKGAMAVKGGPGSRKSSLQWETEVDCAMPSCSVKGDLLTIIPHWQKVHGFTFMRIGHGKKCPENADIPDVLPGPIRWQAELPDDNQEDEPSTELVLYNKSKSSNKTAKKKKKTE